MIERSYGVIDDDHRGVLVTLAPAGRRMVRTAAQAMVRFLSRQLTERDGRRRPLFAGCAGIFGHGNVSGVGQALQQYPEFRYYQARNEHDLVVDMKREYLGYENNLELVKAVTDVRLKSDIAGAGSLIGALANRTNEENQKLYDRMIDTMLNKLDYCQTCAQKTIEYFCTQEDEK